MEGSTCRLERYSVGVAHRRALVGCSRALSVVSDLPQTISAMGPIWSDERSSGSSCPRSQNPRCSGCGGSLHRWYLCTGEKRATRGGKTERGKGTKIMAIADRHGLPVAICI